MAASKDSSQFPSDFAWLAQGRSLGKKVQLLIDPDDAGTLVNPPNVNILELQGPDEAAMNVQLTIAPPLIIRVPTPEITIARAKALVDQQAASGSIDNLANEVSALGHTYTPIIALLDWGIGGVAVKGVEVDIANGLNINLTCSFLRVNVASEPFLDLIGIDAGSAAIYELAAFVGPGYPKWNNAQRTIPLGNFIAARALPVFFGTSPTIPIPKYATRVTFQCGGGAFEDPQSKKGWDVQILFSRNDFNGFTPTHPFFFTDSYVVVSVDDPSCCEFMIPNGMYYATVINNNAFQINMPKLIFDLGI